MGTERLRWGTERVHGERSNGNRLGGVATYNGNML